MGGYVLLGCLVLALVLVVATVAWRGPAEGFYTSAAREDPTRSDVPYTGTIPFGAWGNKPWAEIYSAPGCRV